MVFDISRIFSLTPLRRYTTTSQIWPFEIQKRMHATSAESIAQKMKFFIKDFFSKFDEISSRKGALKKLCQSFL